MALSEPFVGAPTISTTEFSFPSNSTTRVAQTSFGIFQVFLDVMANVVAGDTFRVRVYDKINGAGATQQPLWEATIIGVQSRNLVVPALLLKDGWDVTAIRLAGADRAIPFSIRKVS